MKLVHNPSVLELAKKHEAEHHTNPDWIFRINKEHAQKMFERIPEWQKELLKSK